jgi:hypothetical protein
VEVITQLRLRGLRWDSCFCIKAASKCDLTLLSWLDSVGCDWELEQMAVGLNKDNHALLRWLTERRKQWPTQVVAECFERAAIEGDFDGLQYFLEVHAASWPKKFCSMQGVWDLSAFKFALENGSGWGNWRCQDWKKLHITIFWKDEAAAVLEWAHNNSCPCTCDQQQ